MGQFQHHLFPKDVNDRSKGGYWAYIHSEHVSNFGIAYNPYDIQLSANRKYACFPLNCRSKGKKWMFQMENGKKFSCRIDSNASYKAVKAWTQTWKQRPSQIEKENRPKLGGNYEQKHEWDNKHKVYLVKLLAFEATQGDRHYYKIGKAKIIPRRVRQFGPCLVIEALEFDQVTEAYETENTLHKLFFKYRITKTEIFALNAQELQNVVAEFRRLQADTQK